MPLSADTWSSAMQILTDSTHDDFPGFPSTPEDIAFNWSGVAVTYFTEIVNPPTNPATHVAAAELFQEAMAGALETAPMAGLNALALGLVAYAGAIASAAPTSTIPGGTPVWPVLAPTTDTVAPADAIGLAVQTWAITGLGPTPAAAPWS